MYDKYPPIIYKSKASDWEVVYLGSKVNNNMVSGTAPFRILCHYMLRHMASPILWASVNRALKRLNFEQRVTFRFRQRGSETPDPFGGLSSRLDCNLLDFPTDLGLIDRYIGLLASGNIQLADMSFFRNDEPYGLADLSSGEKQYALAILGFIYCGSQGCTVFYDEPENSLHPAWQLSIVKDLAEVADDQLLKATLIIATHSPLIASSVRNGNVYVCDLPAGQAWQRADLFGRASDTVLREQFHLYSARSPEVAVIINKCLASIARNETGSQEFQQVQAELRGYKLDLTPDDPLAEIVTTILGF
ncbi:AAA family ATPase [Rhizobium ruizarguesonis]|uniref:AAA family ATPase n=1 Tax=Rhizobium ruizarguesonis TaxID=2081791 RepID=UPI001031CE12|nr:AAA family ATPase [Rhizobium ruizarguesonis]TBD34871.1 ATP-binding protein [Rhizobium ruizarguesonis]TBD54525.1 ATP-binding protein [Rhizobium ruizarguesonis]TBF00462.1 ATP-binding protein [Rhizobium ruizarguesonis]